MWNEFERNIFLNFCEQITSQLAEKNKMNATKYTEKQTVLIKKQNIFKSLGLTGLLQST